MARRSPPRKVTYFEPVPPRLARNTVIESTFEVGRRFHCTMRVDCSRLEPGAVIRPVPGDGTRNARQLLPDAVVPTRDQLAAYLLSVADRALEYLRV